MIKLLISDFDGTLVDTYYANLLAYQEAFKMIDKELSDSEYSKCFGYRFDKFMQTLGIESKEDQAVIKRCKAELYPSFFRKFIVNKPLLDFITSFKKSGGKTAIASTARRVNLENALSYIGARDSFDLILAGEEVKKGKPDPEIYLKVLEKMQIQPAEALVFEDSEVGIKAAELAGIKTIVIKSSFYGN